MFLKGFPKGIRSQLATECRPDDLDELQSSIQRFASSRSRTIRSYFIDFKPKSDNVASNSSKPRTDNVSSNFSKHVITNGNKIKVSKPQSDVCPHCNKSGHAIDNCWVKYPEKKPKVKTINHTFPTKNPSHRVGVNFVMKGTLNNKPSDDILLDSGAGCAAIHSKFCPNSTKTGETMTVSSLKNDISIGSYPVVNLPVETLTVNGIIEGVSVDNLKHDAVLPIFNQGNGDKILLNPNNATVEVVKSVPSYFSVKSTEVSSHPEPPNTLSLELPTEISNLTCAVPDVERKTPNVNEKTDTSNSTCADFMSCPTENSNNQDVNDDPIVNSEVHNLTSFLPNAITLELLKSHQNIDIECRKIVNFLKNNEAMFLSPNVQLIMHQGLICKVCKGDNYPYAIYIPKHLYQCILKSYHDESGHLSYTAVAKNISQKFYFPNMYKFIQEYVNNCNVCQYDATARFHKPVPSDSNTSRNETIIDCISYMP